MTSPPLILLRSINCKSSNFPKDLYSGKNDLVSHFLENTQNDCSKNYLMNISYIHKRYHLKIASLIKYTKKDRKKLKILWNFNIPLSKQYFLTFCFEITKHVAKIVESSFLYTPPSLPQGLLLMQLQHNIKTENQNRYECVYTVPSFFHLYIFG